MPCVQAVARKKRREYIEANRRDFNAFDGITDPVEVLKIIHKPRRFDPLINWIPYATQTDQIYTELNRGDQLRLAKYAESLIGTERNEEAAEIMLCLAAFTEAPVEDCLRVLVAHNSFWPSMPFCRASSDIRDVLIARVDRDDKNRNNILIALAWIGDTTVTERFEYWRKHPPFWRESLHIPPQDYSLQAGWELTDEGQRRDLYFHDCTKLLRGPSSSPQIFRAITERKDRCPWCSQRLTNLMEITPYEFDILNTRNSIGHVQVPTCEICTAFGSIVFGVIDETGNGQWSSLNSRPHYLPDTTETWCNLPQNSLTPASKRSALFAASCFLPTTFSQLGGHPTWVQDAAYPQCPICSKRMMFLAQIDHNDIEDRAEGIYYAFLCPACKMTAINYQQT